MPSVDTNLLSLLTKGFIAVPEVHQALLSSSEEYILLSFRSYIPLIKRLIHLTPEDIIKIEKIHQNFKRYLTAGEVEEPGAHTFLHILGEKRRHLLKDALEEILKTDSVLLIAGLTELTVMMKRASTLKQQRYELIDNNKEADRVIWTHTKITNPEAIIHVVLAHLFERCIFTYLKDCDSSLNFTKDYFLNVLDDIILIAEVTSPNGSQIFKMWNTQKNDGGLEWINPDKVRAYRELFTTGLQ